MSTKRLRSFKRWWRSWETAYNNGVGGGRQWSHYCKVHHAPRQHGLANSCMRWVEFSLLKRTTSVYTKLILLYFHSLCNVEYRKSLSSPRNGRKCRAYSRPMYTHTQNVIVITRARISMHYHMTKHAQWNRKIIQICSIKIQFYIMLHLFFWNDTQRLISANSFI